MSLFFLPRRPIALCQCALLMLACGFAVVPAYGQQLAPAQTSGASEAGSDRAFWSEQEELSEAERTALEHNVAVLAKRGYNKWGEKLWNALRAQEVPGSGKSVGELELTDPALAVAFYGDWLSRNTDVAPRSLELRVRVSSLVAQLLARELGDARKALAVYDWSLAMLQVGSDASWQRLAVERDALVLSQRGQGRGAKAVGLDAAATQWASASLSEVGGVKLDAVAASGVRVARVVPDAVEANAMVPSSVRIARSIPDAVEAGETVPSSEVATAPDNVAVSRAQVVGQTNSVVVPPASLRVARTLAEGAISTETVVAPKTDVYAAVPGLIAVPTVKMAERAKSNAAIVNPFATGPSFGAVTLVEGATRGDARTPSMVSENARLAVFDVANARRDAALSQIKLGKLAPEDAWQSGALTYGNVVDFFLNSTGNWVIRERAVDNGLHHQLLALLLKHEGSKFASLPQVPLKLRVWLADYYWTQRDVKAVEVVESVLGELTPRGNGQNMTAYQAVERMAWYYRDTSQPQQSADAWNRWNAYEGSPTWTRIDVDLEMARELEKLGPQTAERVAQLRKSAVAQNDGWRSALVFYDEYRALMEAGKPDEAKRALSQPLNAVTTVADGRIAQNTWLAGIAYQEGDLSEALRLSQEALQATNNVDALDEAPAKNLYAMARDIYNRVGGWKNQPIQTDTKQVVFQSNPSQPDKPLYARFRIKTYGDTSVTASVDNPNVQARVLPVNNWRGEGLGAQEEEMEVIVQSNSLKIYTDVPLVLSSATRGKTTTVRVSLIEKSA